MLNKNFLLILLTNILLGAPMPMLIILGSLAGARLAPDPHLITVAVSAQLLAGILVASPLSLLMGRFGRQKGLLLIACVTIVGALLAALSVYLHWFWLLCLAHFFMGAALVGVNYLRFAAAEVVDDSARPNAISFTLASGIVAALLGPSLFEYSNAWIGSVPFAGAYVAIALLGLLGILPVLGLSLPIPAAPSSQKSENKVTLLQVLRERAEIRLAMVIAAVSQGVMVLMMVPTPQAMIELGHLQAQAADVIRWHVVAMFAPGLITGLLIQKLGLQRVIGAGLSLLFAAALVAVWGTRSVHFYTALVLLGLGWNFGFIGATQLLQQVTPDRDRASVQGLNDTGIAIASVVASVVSGVLYVGVGWPALALIALAVTLIVLISFLIQHYRGAASTLVQ